MLTPSLQLFTLRELPFSAFNFPRIFSILAITLIGILSGLEPSMRALPMPLPVTLFYSVILVWTCVVPIIFILKWWLKRGGRWDGQGNLFNLIAASWLVADVLSTSLAALGIPMLLALPLWLYSVWIAGNAISGAIPKASLGYSIGGIVLTLIPAMTVAAIASTLLGIVLLSMGVPMGQGAQ